MDTVQVVLITPVWSAQALTDPRAEVTCCATPQPDGMIDIVIAFPTNRAHRFPISVKAREGASAGELHVDGGMMHWGLRRLGPGVWAIEPSLHVQGVVHAFAVMCDVPEPPPWRMGS